MQNNTLLESRLRKTRRRLLLIGSASAIVWAVVAAAGALVLAVWLDLVWELSSSARLVADWGAALAAVVLAAALVYRAVRGAGLAGMARRLDTAVQSPGEILTGWELEKRRRGACALTIGLVALAVERAAALSRRASLSKAVSVKPLGRAAAALALLSAVIALLGWAMPELARTECRRFRDPLADVPPFSPLHFVVGPGDVRVLYGDDLEITCKVEGGTADRVDLVLVAADGSQTSLPMFSDTSGSWRTVLSKLTEPTVYFVRSYRARSEKYNIGIITVPRIEKVRVQVAPPEYAGQPGYEGPVPEDGVKGLRGTRVTVWATSNRPLSGGNLLVTQITKKEAAVAVPASAGVPGLLDGSPPARPRSGRGTPAPPSSPDATVRAPMRPSETGDSEAVGQFEIVADGRFELSVTDANGQASQQSFAANVTLVKDQYPLVRILRPPTQSLATPTAELPVVLSAEDDCGISRLELYRNLNRSRPLPVAIPLPSKPPHRHDHEIRLRLADYGLAAGDELTFFARVEDNDPVGAKGCESQVVRVKIISQEEFEHMVRVRQGIEAVASKYRQARRRMEAMAKEVEGLRKKLHDAPPNSRLAQEVREDVRRLQRLMRREAGELRKSTAHLLPLDIDSKLSPEIGNVAAMTEQMAEELEKLDKQLDMANGALEKKLDELLKTLASGRQSYESSVMAPIELLEEVFPLLVDQQRFVVLAMRQEDLAQRTAPLRGHDNEDDPVLKTRMRDLEHEQRTIRTELDALLGDIEDHATRLPDRPELARLRETAQKFSKDVRNSGAAEALGAAEAALADFAGTRAHDKAKEASEILNRFVKRCEGEIGADCRGALVFQPMLAQSLGNTIAQLLSEMGLGGGAMPGSGGAMGLYGQIEGTGAGGGEFGEPQEGRSGNGGEPGATASSGGNPDAMTAEEALANGAAAAANEGSVPLRYRRAVRQYFQRLGEELGDRASQQDRRAQP